MKQEAEKDHRLLCRAVERHLNRECKAPSDFKWLSKKIEERTHEYVSHTTLMRLWGYLPSVSTRTGTLDILARFLGYMGYDDFCRQQPTTPSLSEEEQDEQPEASHVTAENAPLNRTSKRFLYGMMLSLLLIIAVCGAYVLLHKPSERADDETHILRKGQRFASYGEYMALFGITEVTGQPWSQPLPNHDNILVFGGQYHHPQWGNEGDSANLLPTRTEHWHDASLPPEVELMQNRQHYYAQKEINRLAITFMKDLVDTGFVFCGVYRMSLELSDTTHVVWERVADELDLLHLDHLERLRN